MVHRPSDSRLLTSLLSNEKEYHKQLLGLLDNYSQQSLGAFAAYASASPAPVARAVIAVAGSFAGADDALRRYAISIEAWQEELRTLKDLEDEVGNVIRDREILVTRLIKLSKNQKPTRDSFISTLGSSGGEASQISLNSFISPGSSSTKLGAAQSELHACEAHLAAKERELDELRVSAVRRGLDARCKAMVECGWNWGEMGKEGLRALEGIDSPFRNGTDGPSQSASQINFQVPPLVVPTSQPITTPPRVTSPPPVLSRPSSPLPAMTSSSSVTLRIPPAHSISELTLPSTTLERRISDVPEELEQEDSSEEDSRQVEIVENPRFAGSTTSISRRFSIRASHTREYSGSNTTSSGTGTGTGSFSQPASSTLAPPNHPSPHTAPQRERKSSGRFFSSIAGLFRGGGSISSGHSSGTEKWKTRTQSNLRAVRRTEDTDSEDDALTESPTRRIFGRRALRESPTPSSPAASQKLRKRKAWDKEKNKDQGWISDSAAVRGRDARKASVKQRATLTDEPLRPASRPVPAVPGSAPMRSLSRVSASSTLMSAPGSSTPSPTKPSAKHLRTEVIARSSSANISRQSSMRSTGSVPPVPRRNATERAANLPPSQSMPGVVTAGRSSSIQHGRSRSATYISTPSPPPHAHPDAGRHASGAGSSQMSLMAIVEGVTRNNRAAWDRANDGLPTEPGGSTIKGGGLLSVRAPPSVTKYNLRGEDGSGISFESVLAPPSVFATPPPLLTTTPSSSSARQRPTSLPPPPRLPMPPTSPGTAPKIPLRSALRTQSPPPKPPPKPIVIPLAPPRVVVEPPSHSPTPNGGDHGDEASDSGSIASYRTVRETFSETSSPIPPPSPTPAPAPAPASALMSASSLAIPGQDDSDVSTSTISVNDASGPTRRKSVRVSLQPTFSPTPPAIDEDEDAAWERSGRLPSSPPAVPPKRGGAVNGVAHDGDDEGDDGDDQYGKAPRGKKKSERERDFWADSSDEDEQYTTARRMLTRANRKWW